MESLKNTPHPRPIDMTQPKKCEYTPHPHKTKGVEIMAEGPGCREDVDELLKDAGTITSKWFRSKITYLDDLEKQGKD